MSTKWSPGGWGQGGVRGNSDSWLHREGQEKLALTVYLWIHGRGPAALPSCPLPQLVSCSGPAPFFPSALSFPQLLQLAQPTPRDPSCWMNFLELYSFLWELREGLLVSYICMR